MFRSIFSFCWEMVESMSFALAVFVVTYLFFFSPGVVQGASSYPTWQENERFVTDKISYKFSLPKRGDFVVIVSPTSADVDFIKRIVGLPGETIKIDNCKVYINGEIYNEEYLQPNTCTAPDSLTNISDGYYFVMGDNRTHSSDSRFFGPIPYSSIVGKVAVRYWPLEKFGKI